MFNIFTSLKDDLPMLFYCRIELNKQSEVLVNNLFLFGRFDDHSFACLSDASAAMRLEFSRGINHLIFTFIQI